MVILQDSFACVILHGKVVGERSGISKYMPVEKRSGGQMKKPVLYIVIPCYNEQEVLPITSKMFLAKLMELIEAGKMIHGSLLWNYPGKMSIISGYPRAGTEGIKMHCWRVLWRPRINVMSPYL